jgi:hypothetical protein
MLEQTISALMPRLQVRHLSLRTRGAYNAIIRFEDFKQPQQEERQDQRLERTWFGGGADIKLKALSKAKELCANWN